MDMIIFEEASPVTPEMWDAVRRYDRYRPTQPMSKADIIRRREEGRVMYATEVMVDMIDDIFQTP